MWGRGSNKDRSFTHDLDEVASGERKFMPEPAATPVDSEFASLLPKRTGTLVVWSNCDRLTLLADSSGARLPSRRGIIAIGLLDRLPSDAASVEWQRFTY